MSIFSRCNELTLRECKVAVQRRLNSLERVLADYENVHKRWAANNKRRKALGKSVDKYPFPQKRHYRKWIRELKAFLHIAERCESSPTFMMHRPVR